MLSIAPLFPHTSNTNIINTNNNTTNINNSNTNTINNHTNNNRTTNINTNNNTNTNTNMHTNTNTLNNNSNNTNTTTKGEEMAMGASGSCVPADENTSDGKEVANYVLACRDQKTRSAGAHTVWQRGAGSKGIMGRIVQDL